MSNILDSIEMRTAKAKVLAILRDFPETRDSDALLYARYYERYYGKKTLTLSIRAFFTALHRKQLTDPDNIRRVRADIQNRQVLYLPTTPEIRKIRLKNKAEEYWGLWLQKERELNRK